MSEQLCVTAPTSKSLSHRYCIAAALAQGESVLRHVLDSADIRRTRAILGAVGANFQPIEGEENAWRVTGLRAGRPLGGLDSLHAVSCDVGESGTTCRLLTAVLAAGQGFFRIHGAPRMHERPIAHLTDALRRLGVEIQFEEKNGYPPLVLQTRGLSAPQYIEGVVVDMGQSSQFFSGLLLAAPLELTNEPLGIRLGGDTVVSWPYVGLTLQCLEDFGIRFKVQTRQDTESPWEDLEDWRALRQAIPGRLQVKIWSGAYRAGTHVVEGDWSGASYMLARGAMGRRPLRVEGIRADSLQGDRHMLDILRRMGARMEVSENAVTAFPSALHGVDLDMGHCPDLVPTVTVLAACANGPTWIHNVAHLRIKESDRIAAPVMELSRLGVEVEENADGLVIHGVGAERLGQAILDALRKGVSFRSHNDHRIAMSLAMLECVPETKFRMDILLDDPSVVDKSFPQFWQLWEMLRHHC